MQDVIDLEQRHPPSYTFNNVVESSNSRSNNRGDGFFVQGGPWEQRAPNTASVTEFPSFGNRNHEEPQVAPMASAWGPRR